MLTATKYCLLLLHTVHRDCAASIGNEASLHSSASCTTVVVCPLRNQHTCEGQEATLVLRLCAAQAACGPAGADLAWC
jgi:hypothetical protein